MTDLRKAAEQALEALEDARRHNYALRHKETDELVTALRAALAQEAQVSTTICVGCGGSDGVHAEACHVAKRLAQQKPKPSIPRDDIRRMAQEAGLLDNGILRGATDSLDRVASFAALVAEHARNRTWTQAHWTEYERSIAAAEREQCAKLCDEVAYNSHTHTGASVPDFVVGTVKCAAAIRGKTND